MLTIISSLSILLFLLSSPYILQKSITISIPSIPCYFAHPRPLSTFLIELNPAELLPSINAPMSIDVQCGVAVSLNIIKNK